MIRLFTAENAEVAVIHLWFSKSPEAAVRSSDRENREAEKVSVSSASSAVKGRLTSDELMEIM